MIDDDMNTIYNTGLNGGSGSIEAYFDGAQTIGSIYINLNNME